jgi:hypothetical protein
MTGQRERPRDSGARPKATAPDEATGLPGLRRWSSVYWVVLGIFALWVVLLTVLTKRYS